MRPAINKALFVAGAALALLMNARGEGKDAVASTVYFDSSAVDRKLPDVPKYSAGNAIATVDRTIPEDTTVETARNEGFEQLGGNLSKMIEPRGKPYLVTSDVYVPAGKTIRVAPGVIMLFKNFTGMHVEGRLVVEGTPERPVVFSSEFDKTYNPSSELHANPYDWNGITIYDNGLGSTFSQAKLMYSVFGINSLTKYIKLDKMFFSNNGRSDCIIEGKERTVTAQPFSYALTIDDARKDGVPVKILMDPRAKKRNLFRYGGLTLLVGGCAASIWSMAQNKRDQERLNALSDPTVRNENSNLVKNENSDWEKARSDKNLDIAIGVITGCLAVLGGTGFGFSFTF
jgi:hypothetical protein